MHTPSPNSSKIPFWSDEHAILLSEARQAAGFESSTLAIHNTLSLKQLNELETGGCSAFYSESIKYTTGVKLLRKLGVPFDHLETANELPPPDAAETKQVATNKDESIRAISGPVAAISSDSTSRSNAWQIFAMLAVLIGLGYWLFPVEKVQPSQQVLAAVDPNEVKAAPPVETSATPLTSAASESAATSPPATGPLPTDALEKSIRNALCAFNGRGVEVASSYPTKPADYVYVTATQKTQICIRDATGKTISQTLNANQSQNVAGAPPFQFAAESPGDVKIYFQGQRVYAQSDVEFLILKGMPFKSDRVE